MDYVFLDKDAAVVVELDGAQHLSNADTYRSDRLKDRLLQQHGYLVRRFLAEDVGKDLELVLDTILAVVRVEDHNVRQLCMWRVPCT